MVQEILRIAPTADRLLELTDRELQLALLPYVTAATDDPLSRNGVTAGGTITQLFDVEGFIGAGYINSAKRRAVEKHVKRAWRGLEQTGLIEEPDETNGASGYRIVTAQGREVRTNVDIEAANNRAWLKPEHLHADLREACYRAFASADYNLAVFEAFRAVEAKVTARSGVTNAIGVNLMAAAFDPPNGPLRDQTATEPRQRARTNLFKGAMGELRNPRAHGGPPITNPLEAIEEIMTASLLLRIMG